MKKTNNFFLIHNYNTLPEKLLEYCEDYFIMDASEDLNITETLQKKRFKFQHIENTGHNITSYFTYFSEHYNNLPEVICLCKGNMIGRHISEEYFNRVYRNTYFTYLYEEKQYRNKYTKITDNPSDSEGIASLVTESQYIERNTSWYVDSSNHPHRFFDNLDDLLLFIYQDPILPRYCLFSPGACYIVRREQIYKHSKEFYTNMNKIMNYGMNPSFPAEAHMVERLLPTIFEAAYLENPWMNDINDFDNKLKERLPIIQKKDEWRGKRLKRLRLLLGEQPY